MAQLSRAADGDERSSGGGLVIQQSNGNVPILVRNLVGVKGSWEFSERVGVDEHHLVEALSGALLPCTTCGLGGATASGSSTQLPSNGLAGSAASSTSTAL